MTGPLPHILEQPLIPPPLHGVNPRSIMGPTDWGRMRREIHAKHGYTCAACGVHKSDALIRTGLEAHELYRIDWRRQRMTLIGMEPLCHACHAFVHGGLLQVRIARGAVTRDQAIIILGNGAAVLGEIDGKMPGAADLICRRLGLRHGLKVAKTPPRTPWRGWVLEWDGKEYPSPYPTEADWARAMRKRKT